MTSEAFQETLRLFLHRKPFLPFVAVLLDGSKITIDRSSVAMNGGGAGFLSDEEGLIDFTCDQVHHFEVLKPEFQA